MKKSIKKRSGGLTVHQVILIFIIVALVLVAAAKLVVDRENYNSQAELTRQDELSKLKQDCKDLGWIRYKQYYKIIDPESLLYGSIMKVIGFRHDEGTLLLEDEGRTYKLLCSQLKYSKSWK